MDIVTLNKIISNFEYSTTCNIDSSFLSDEIEELINLNVIQELDDGRYRLNKNQLYSFAKATAKEGNIQTAIAIYNYLLGFKNQNSKSWFFTIHYQLFKLYLNHGDLHNAYECFKQGFDRRNDYYPAVLNMLDYLLKIRPEIPFSDESIDNLFTNKKFKELKEVYSNKSINSTESNKKMFNFVCDMAISLEEQIDNHISSLIHNNNYEELKEYTRSLIKANRSNETIRLIGFLSETFLYIIHGENINQSTTKKYYDIINMFQLYNVDKVIKEYELDSKYSSDLFFMLKSMLIHLSKEGYHKNLKKYINRKVRNVNNKNAVVIINDLNDYGNILTLDAALNSNVDINSVLFEGDKKLIITKRAKEVLDYDRNDIIDLYEARQNKECIIKCLKYIQNCPDDFEIYDILVESYMRLGNKKDAAKYSLLKETRNSNIETSLSIKNEAKFYGISDIESIIDFINKYNVPFEIAGLNFGLNEYQIEVLALLLSRYYYAINDEEKGAYYLNCISNEDKDLPVIKYLESEINNPNSYVDINYGEAKSLTKKLEKK